VKKPIRKILIANRGEIAVRVIRTARKLGIGTVAIYSTIDKDSLHVMQADEAWCIGEVELSETYLNIPKIIGAAKESHCDAIHPGYGFLAENPLFVEACNDAGIIFIGPGAGVMKTMGNKIAARAFAKKIGIPVTEGVTGSKKELAKTAHKIGFPVLLKAAAGGGGKGMQIVREEKMLEEAIESASRQAKAYFGDETVYIEKYIEEPRHIEVQILGDNYGNVIHLFERECSIQRRYQKIIEESPSPTLTAAVRKQMCDAAVRIGKEIGYSNAGTIEFLVDRDLNFYFLEMNTRIQVEHPVTELVTGTDIVEEQVHIASGAPLRLKQEEVLQNGHAIECRIYAEDPENNFQPSPGRMTLYREPPITGIRIDTGITVNTEIKSSFDPMICKLVVWGKDRREARQTMISALHEYVIHGIRTNILYLTRLLQGDAFVQNTISTKFCDEHTAQLVEEIRAERAGIPTVVPVVGYLISTLAWRGLVSTNPCEPENPWESIGYWRNRMQIRMEYGEQDITVQTPSFTAKHYTFLVDGQRISASPTEFSRNSVAFSMDHTHYRVWISEDPDGNAYVSSGNHIFRLKRHDILPESAPALGQGAGDHPGNFVTSPMPGKVIRILVEEGAAVKHGDVLVIIEAMKMENTIAAPRDTVIGKINVQVNDRVETSTPLIFIEERNDKQGK
jgi:3-methylcrotonyl-CoA carboxylase alpha subunit